MNISTGFDRDQNGRSDRDVFTHWAWAIPVLLLVAALGLAQIDLYPPSPDEFYTMYDLGWLANEARSPSAIVNTIRENNPSQSPGYFLLLSLWGNLTGYSLPVGRVLGVFGGLLSLAIMFRIAKDLVAPEAGLFAIIILASNAFYNMYIPFLRMYAMLVFVAGLSLWLYFRVVQKRGLATRRDRFALSAALTCLLYTHGFGTLMIIALGVYHVLFVPKNRAWHWLTLSIILAMLLFSPWLWVLFDAMTPEAGSLSIVDRLSSPVVESRIVIRALLSTITNGQLLLLALSAIGIATGLWRRWFKLQPYVMLFVIVAALLFCVAEYRTWVRIGTLRHHLYSWPMAVLFFASGHYCLYRLHRWLGISVVFWIIAGIAFQLDGNWNQLAQDRNFNVSRSPWHQISRMAVLSDRSLEILAYKTNPWILNWRGYVDYSQREHYFDNNGIGFSSVHDAQEIDSRVRPQAIILPRVWIVLRPSRVAADESANINAVMSELSYELCDSIQAGNDTSVLQYAWKASRCGDLGVAIRSSNRLIDYRFYGARLEEDKSRILFADDWTTRSEFESDNYNMSYQLLSPDWVKVAQLDLPLVHEATLRQFSIDIRDVPTGAYQLAAIFYDNRSIEPIDWIENEGTVSFMMPLDDIVVTASS